MELIPFKLPAQWRAAINLDNIQYNLIFRWNAMNQYWVMDILTSEDLPVIFGVKIVTNYNLLMQYSMDNKPPGNIICQNIVGGWEAIRRYDMGQTNELVYYVQGELETYLESLINDVI